MAEKHSVELFLRQNVTEALKSAGKAALSTRLGLSQVGPAAKASFEMAGSGMTMLNQSLEVGKKAIELFRSTIGASIETALQFRRAGDETVQYFKDLGRESELVKARLGDALLPVLRGFTEAAGEATGSISEWIAENQKLIGSNLISFLGQTAELLTTGVASAVSIVAKAFYGWQIVVQGVGIAINEMFAGALSIIGDFLATTQKVAEQVGAKGLAASIGAARESVQGLGAEFSSSSEEAQKGILETVAKLDSVEKTIRKVETSVKSVIEKGMVRAQERVQQATVGLTKTIEEQTDALAKQGEMIDKIMQRRIAAIESEQALREKDARSIDAQEQAAAGSSMTGAQAGQQLLGSAGPVGGLVSAGMTGGGMAFAAQAGAMIIAESEALSGILDSITEQFGVLVEAMEPLFEALKPITTIVSNVVATLSSSLTPIFRSLGKALMPILIAITPLIDMFIKMNPAMLLLQAALGVIQPVIEGLGIVFKKVAGIMLSIGETIAKIWNGIVDAIAGVLKKLGGISVWGAKPLGFLEDWGNDLQRKASISTDSFDEARRRMEEGYEVMSESIDDGATQIAESTKEIQDSMSNVPSGIKLAYERFRAATGVERTSASMPDIASPRDRLMSGASQAVNNFLGPIHVNGVTNIAELQREIADEAAIQQQLQHGALAATVVGFF